MWTYNLKTAEVSMVNDAALDLYGYSRQEFLNLDLYAIRVEEEHQRLKEHLDKKTLHSQDTISGEWRHVKKDGSIIVVEVVSHLVKINGQKSRLVVIKDITAQKKAKQEILRQNLKLREIAYISSHEVRKPAANILGLVNLFDKQNLGNKLNAEIIEYLEITAKQLDQVIGRIIQKTGKGM
ncbi:MAG TPA: PAS domain S-box protein, partial [Daejeonella sp.]|nr:PAS domain S-box protein [Daejeonella sp.]